MQSWKVIKIRCLTFSFFWSIYILYVHNFFPFLLLFFPPSNLPIRSRGGIAGEVAQAAVGHRSFAVSVAV